MDLSKLLNPKYLFEVYPGEFSFMPFFIGLFVLLFLASLSVDRWMKRHPHHTSLKHLLPGFPEKLRILGVVGLIFLWVRYENLPYFSMRFFFLVFLLYIVWVIGHAIYLYKKRLPQVVAQHHAIKTADKYLPKKKR